jgi:DNA-3-methyladenine glycosylase II
MEIQKGGTNMMTLDRLHSTTGTLTPRAPFDYAKTLGFLYGFGPTAGEQALVIDSLTKALTLQGRAVAFEVRSTGTVEQPALAYTLFSEHVLSEAEHAAVADRISFFISLDEDLQPFYAIARRDPRFATVIEGLYGLHQPKFLSPFEIACWAVLGQRIPWRVAHKLKMALVERWGTSITLPGGSYAAFPEPQQLAAVKPEELTSVVRNERKVEYLQAVIQFFLTVDEHFLRYGDYEEVSACIRAIRGIGEWSSYFILLRGLGRMERVSAIDRELGKAASHIYNNGQPLSTDQMQRLLDQYGAEQGHWAFYIRNATPERAAAMEMI